jgi:enoyl-CoA hydratase/carnithine racemase
MLSAYEFVYRRRPGMSDDIKLEVSEGVGLIRFNRPESLNTFTGGMMEALGDAYREVDADDKVRVVVVTGSGRAFCAGADLSEGGSTFDKQEDMSFSSSPLSFTAQQVRKPVIAACNGHAVGVGLGIAIQADMRVLAEEGKYGFLQSQRGVIADFAVHHILPRMLGLEAALEMIVSGRRYTGQEALELGLARRLVPSEQVLSTAMELAGAMATDCAPLITGMAKQLVWAALDQDVNQAIEVETKALHYTMGRPDALEGGMAFFEKRKPEWQGLISKDWPDFL